MLHANTRVTAVFDPYPGHASVGNPLFWSFALCPRYSLREVAQATPLAALLEFGSIRVVEEAIVALYNRVLEGLTAESCCFKPRQLSVEGDTFACSDLAGG